MIVCLTEYGYIAKKEHCLWKITTKGKYDFTYKNVTDTAFHHFKVFISEYDDNIGYKSEFLKLGLSAYKNYLEIKKKEDE